MADPWAPFRSKYTLDNGCNKFIELMVKHSAGPFSNYKLADARKVFSEICKDAGGKEPFDGQTKEIKVDVPHAKGGIPCTVYIPKNVAKTPAILLYCHGGGLVLWDRQCFDSVLKRFAQRAACIIASIEYRRLPDECSGYGLFDDVIAVTKYVQQNKAAFGGQPGSKVGLGGDSSGAQIALSASNNVAVDFLFLVYPHCDTALEKPSIEEFKACPVLPCTDLAWFTDLVKKDLPDQKTDPRVCALARKNLKSLPPTLVLLAEIDPLRDGGASFVELAKSAGAKVTHHLIKGVPHCFFGMLNIFPEKCNEAIDHGVKFVKEHQQ